MTKRDDILQAARDRFGIPYGLPPGPGETDCSLYVRDVYEAVGLPFSPGVRVAEQERQDTVPISFDEVLPGDLLFFERTYDAPGPAGPDGHIASHIGISLGAGTRRMYDANDGRGTSGETNIGTPYWQGHLLEARRHPALMDAVIDETGPTGRAPGIDVSNHQETIAWPAVAASGQEFAFIKATEADGYRDPYFPGNWIGSRENGIARGAYHFARPEYGNSAQAEADHFLNYVVPHGIGTGDMLVLDLEPDPSNVDVGAWALEWLKIVEQRTGVVPIVYTGPWIIDREGLDDYTDLARYALWLAAYQPTQPRPPAPWTSIAFWQYTDKGRVPGVSGNCDQNWFNAPAELLAKYGKPGAIVTPPPGQPDYALPGQVGTGILEMMAADGTKPAMPSTFLPLGASPAVAEQCWGMNGTQYLWHIPTGRSWRYKPAA